MTRIGIYPGTFDPPTLGHLDIIGRAGRLVDRLVIGVGVNPAKNPFFTLEERIALVKAETAGLKGKTEFQVEPFSGLAVQFALKFKAGLILRGLRSVTDLDYEAQMAGMNATMAPGVETVFLYAGTGTQSIAATHVRDIARMGGDVTPFVSSAVAAALRLKLAKSAPQKA